ncbi:hypothetical protein CPAR01_00164 [Colletotrichum paranaense]|uniref:Uncharacterized protein n=4 Tax=Colletotrichum acutatum species complex TaxID=2707335 RepID=A0AAI9YUI0_9PEZI|nr:uncharacterized protein CCOS01_09527 [Colletotrichum costaricense]XP_060355314.1 uncharacterized protein CPAR01_00164 [Colletotrichum paranaense]XP_060379883.1 uncharacterized protein CTAM01_09408 [Colletotrichum tamarilloi]KAI3536278.1 hypothetical protein CSPX01_10907 [Colletotrichum filicis]KAK1498145.1 hypothetical protein CCUS01_12921 [Colletotrichum cuscutae]KAK1707252.1 hypothetical protein BDP67DRAFT_527640 [Colletotrichum lupini]KAK1493264.1 hypothetical protein CTAM01_09408 [Coll
MTGRIIFYNGYRPLRCQQELLRVIQAQQVTVPRQMHPRASPCRRLSFAKLVSRRHAFRAPSRRKSHTWWAFPRPT